MSVSDLKPPQSAATNQTPDDTNGVPAPSLTDLKTLPVDTEPSDNIRAQFKTHFLYLSLQPPHPGFIAPFTRSKFKAALETHVRNHIRVIIRGEG